MMGEEPVEKNIGSEIAVEDGRCNGVQYTHDLCLQIEHRWSRSRTCVGENMDTSNPLVCECVILYVIFCLRIGHLLGVSLALIWVDIRLFSGEEFANILLYATCSMKVLRMF